MNLKALLKFVVDKKGTDLFINVGAPPMVKINGKMKPIGQAPLTPTHVKDIIATMLTEEQRADFEENREIDLGYTVEDCGRFRLNAYHQKGEPALVARYIVSHIPSIADLNLPTHLEELALTKRGLILVVGATGTGKSTTLASMINYRNESISGHILTVEDPIEFLHSHKKSLISQREVGIDTHSYRDALINAMRESPDAILIGEARDQDTMKYALTFAETGHACFTTLHANNARQALDRVVNLFPQNIHSQVRADLAEHLIAVISQRLPIGTDGMRIPAVEVLMCTPYIRELIREGDTEKLQEAMLKDVDDGSQTFDQALYGLYIAQKVSKEEALKHADSKDNLNLMIRFGD
ncbi:Twitching mobility protein [BD1-7 clade bacterium]|uniref:Twitching mobility protein n=1 Tax=BD1-7 clade bacterium TaxID=2029982 RepID=A0A5S9QTI5_9GAMM|nr:Twitching mobility protein [BD1-7 clade bacterium]CAA0122660.1 Twitching mobility protein [BD1-7 clade bacterium]